MSTKKATPQAKKDGTAKTLSTPASVNADTIITVDWVGKPFVITAVQSITTQFGPAYLLTGHGANSKKTVTALCGAKVLVKTLAEHIEGDGDFPVTVTVKKPAGKNYFVFA